MNVNSSQQIHALHLHLQRSRIVQGLYVSGSNEHRQVKADVPQKSMIV